MSKQSAEVLHLLVLDITYCRFADELHSGAETAATQMLFLTDAACNAGGTTILIQRSSVVTGQGRRTSFWLKNMPSMATSGPRLPSTCQAEQTTLSRTTGTAP